MDLPAEAQSEDDFLSIEFGENLHLLAPGLLGEAATSGQDEHDHDAHEQRDPNLDDHHPSVPSGSPILLSAPA